MDPSAADPKIVAEVVKALLGLDITPSDLSALDESDPAAVLARNLAATKGK